MTAPKRRPTIDPNVLRPEIVEAVIREATADLADSDLSLRELSSVARALYASIAVFLANHPGGVFDVTRESMREFAEYLRHWADASTPAEMSERIRATSQQQVARHGGQSPVAHVDRRIVLPGGAD